MSRDDLPVVLYKILAYVYECMKRGTIPTMTDVRKLCEVNDSMISAALSEAIDESFLKGVKEKHYWSGSEYDLTSARLTLKGSEYLLENSTMEKSRKLLGEPFQIILSQVVGIAAKAAGF